MNQLRAEAHQDTASAQTYDTDVTQQTGEAPQQMRSYSGELAVRGTTERVAIAYRDGYDEFME